MSNVTEYGLTRIEVCTPRVFRTLARHDWIIKTEANLHMHADLNWFYIKGSLTASENNAIVFQREYNEKVERRFV